MGDKRPAILLDEGVAHWCWSQGHIENVATAIALAITDERSTGRIYNFGEAEIPSMGEWLRKIGQAAGWNGEVVVVPKGRLPILAEFLRLREDVEHSPGPDQRRGGKGQKGSAARRSCLQRP